jgi:O-antigen ligase
MAANRRVLSAGSFEGEGKMARMRERRRIPPARPEVAPASPGRSIALGVFALMAVGAPLSFGAVDPLAQIGLLFLLLIGILAQPPAMVPLSRWGNRLAIAFVVLVLFKEFAPAAWFGDTLWRTALHREFALELPFTHHPEPGRAIEGMLSGAVGVIWFLWVRRLAADRDNRPLLAWILVAAAAIVAVVSFVTRNPVSEAIYGLRYTPGWSGFGPFPNRNHSADYFAMAAVLGCGCLTWAGFKKKWWLLAVGVALVAVLVIALLVTESRGGLIAFVVGLGGFLTLCLLKVRNRRALGAALAGALVFGAMALAFGSQVFARFHSREAGDVSTLTRLHIWQEAIGMWRDAPLLGHGLGAFASIFPLYQKLQLENQVVIHPESSWLQWLTELGAIPVLLAVAAGVLFFGGHLRDSFSRHRSFFLRAGGFAAGAALLVHAFIDVPAHRWGTAGFALAALALACPMRTAGRRTYEPRRTALVPLAVAVFWLLPFLSDMPRWSPTSLLRLISRQAVPPGVPLSELDASLGCFPLNAELHQSAGFRLLQLHGREKPQAWQREFAIAARLVPGSWYVTTAQARSVQRISSVLALPYWQESVARGGIHRDEILGDALQETGGSPAARAAWGRYAEANPQLLLAYARLVPDMQAGYYYGRWWKQRAHMPDLNPAEVRDFYLLAARWGNREQLDEWMTQRASREPRDFRDWAALLHAWREDDRAWKLLAAHTTEPTFPRNAPTHPRPQLESTWRMNTQNLVNAQQLAQIRDLAGEHAERDEILVAVATSAKAPPWFIDKAAYILARQGRVPEAVSLLLRPR